MSAEETILPHPAEQAGVLIGRAYAAAVAGLAAQVRKPAAPTWHWRAAHRAGTAARAAAGRGMDVVERRTRTAPRRLVDGVKRLLKAGWGGSWRSLGTRAGTTAFLGWWGCTWATEAGVSPRLAAWTALGVGTVIAYAAGREPAERPMTRREKARQQTAVRNLLAAIHHMLQGTHGLHLADLADQITARSQAHGTPINCTTGSLRALLEPLGVPIRQQLALGTLNRAGIHAGDWRVWVARHQGTTPPPRGDEVVAPTCEEPLPPPETATESDPLDASFPQVGDGGLEISGRDLGQDEPPGEGLHAPYTGAQLRLLEHVRTTIGTARGAHLRDILTTMQTAGDATDWTVKRLRQELEAASIRIEDKLWLNGGNTRGVLATSLPEPEES